MDGAQALDLTPVKERLPPVVVPLSQVVVPSDRIEIHLAIQPSMIQVGPVGVEGRSVAYFSSFHGDAGFCGHMGEIVFPGA